MRGRNIGKCKIIENDEKNSSWGFVVVVGGLAGVRRARGGTLSSTVQYGQYGKVTVR